jgi:transposase-like protein
MTKRRIFSKAFKQQVVEELLSGRTTQAQLIRQYSLSYNLLSNWRAAYRAGRFGADNNTKVLETQVLELQRKVGELTMENDLLKRAAKFAALQQNDNGLLYSGPVCDKSNRDVS